MNISSLIILLSSVGHAWEVKTNAQGDPLHWKTNTIPIHYNPEHSGLSSQQVSNAIEQAAQAWSYSFTTLQNKGETTQRSITHEDEHYSVLFSDDWNEDPDILALTYTWSKNDGEIVHFDIEMNADHFVWSIDGNSQTHDLQNTLTHELGHALGLDHSNISQATMAASSTAGETSKRALHEDDKEGHSYIYSHPLEGSGSSSSGDSPPSNPNGSFDGNDNPDKPNTSGGSYGMRKPVNACATTTAPLSLLWISLIGIFRRRR